MLPEYCLKISFTPHKHDNPYAPYYWSILELKESWGQVLCGWSSTPQAAFQEAIEQYPAIISSLPN